MDYLEEEKPSPSEIRQFLLKILGSSGFAAARTQSSLLKTVTECAINTASMNEAELGLAVFENYNSDSHVVRATATIVRKKLRAYYSTEGQNDLIQLELPEGPLYAVRARYNPHSYTLIRYERAAKLFSRCTYRSAEAAKCLLAMVVHGDDNEVPQKDRFGPAYLLYAECHLVMFVTGQIFPDPDLGHPNEETSRFHLDECIKKLHEAYEIDPNSAHIPLLWGALFLLLGQVDSSTDFFDSACIQDFSMVSHSLWYALHLWLAKQQTNEAIGIAEDLIRLSPQNSAARYLATLMAYSKKDYVLAHRFLNDMISEDAVEDYTSVLHGLLALAEGEYWKADAYFGILPSHFLSGCRTLNSHLEGKIEEANNRLASMRVPESASSLDLSIAHIAFGRTDEALRHFGNALREYSVAAVWSSALPVFDLFPKVSRERVITDYLNERFSPDEDAPSSH